MSVRGVVMTGSQPALTCALSELVDWQIKQHKAAGDAYAVAAGDVMGSLATVMARVIAAIGDDALRAEAVASVGPAISSAVDAMRAAVGRGGGGGTLQ